MSFDRTRFDWYPTVTRNGVTFTPDMVRSSTGSPRPRLDTPLTVFVVHYGGAGAWLDPGDTALELAAIETNHAIPQGKPNEYNSASDSESLTWEWAGPYRAAHSSGNNSTTWGHLTVLGLEVPTEAQADLLIAGIRRARRQAVEAGWLTADHFVIPHRHAPGASTACPGPIYTVTAWWERIIAPLDEESSNDMGGTYLVIPPPERVGSEWLLVTPYGVRPATTFDVDDGIPQRRMEAIPATYRVGQYEALRRCAGLG